MSEKKWFKNVWAGVIPIQYKSVRLTSAEILAMYTTPKALLDAPGAGKVIEFLSAVFFLDHGGTDYAAGGAAVIQTVTGNTAVSDAIAAGTLVNASADVYVVAQALSAEVALDVNEGLELTNASAVHTTGNGILIVDIAYRIHDFN
ncbi:hypothetical protein LCGC14_0359940 [marine sediment metagenome]|uniref:Uncharacterized protein n=1 Tax=marine sediment metagenome TaxID=412755 RepID=A0A0F9T8A4_9ZZZZ